LVECDRFPRSEIEDNILLSLPPSSTYVKIIRLSFSLVLLLSYPIALFPVSQILDQVSGHSLIFLILFLLLNGIGVEEVCGSGSEEYSKIPSTIQVYLSIPLLLISYLLKGKWGQ